MAKAWFFRDFLRAGIFTLRKGQVIIDYCLGHGMPYREAGGMEEAGNCGAEPEAW